jgi:hypothetical protein
MPLTKLDDSHRHSVERIFPRLGETTTTDEPLKLLQEHGITKAFETPRRA